MGSRDADFFNNICQFRTIRLSRGGSCPSCRLIKSAEVPMVVDIQAIPLKTCSLEPVWFVWVQLWERDDARVREAVADAIGLNYGSYDRVAFESAFGTSFFRPREGAKSGKRERTSEVPDRVLTFSLPRNPEMLGQAIEAIRYAHTLEEPVIYVTEGLATRADYSTDRSNPNRWWNRGFEI
jgi:hypothetical protein